MNLVGLLLFWFSVPLLLDDDCESCWFAGVLHGSLFLCFYMVIVNLVGLLVSLFSVPLLLDEDCESCWFAVVLVLCSSASR